MTLHLWMLSLSLLPLLGAVGMVWSPLRPIAVRLAPGFALSAMFFASIGKGTTLDLPTLGLGVQLFLNTTGALFLGITALVWFAAGLFGLSYFQEESSKERFTLFYLLTMAGNFGVILAEDVVTFLCAYALMSFSAYGWIIHDRDSAAFRAGRLYIGLVIVGEVLLFAVAVLVLYKEGNTTLAHFANAIAQSSSSTLLLCLTITAFGIKLGLVPLHMWLPLAHPAAPVPASAILSGVLLKAGLLGLWRWLPLGKIEAPTVGSICIALGLLSAFGGALIGATQKKAKAVLAYSSISQMGLLVVGLGIALQQPKAWPLVAAVASFFIWHHACAKAALFLGVGLISRPLSRSWQRPLWFAGMLLPAISLAGFPLTSGALTKDALKSAGTLASSAWISSLGWLLPLTGMGTTALMARLIYLCWTTMKKQTDSDSLSPLAWFAWLLLVCGLLALPWLQVYLVPELTLSLKWNTALSWWKSLWPPGLLFLLLLPYIRGSKTLPFSIPPGDIWNALENGFDKSTTLLSRLIPRKEFLEFVKTRTVIPFASLQQRLSKLLKHGEELLQREHSQALVLLLFLILCLFLLS